MKNVLFSTTRQWNPGDEFILFGAMNVLRSVIGEFNPAIYNRNPETRQSFQFLNPFRRLELIRISFRLHEIIEAFIRLRFMDNSFKDSTPLDVFDLVVFAGSPEFASRRLKPLYRKLQQCKCPTVYLGVGQKPGQGRRAFREPYHSVLKKARLLTVRDRQSVETLSDYGAVYLPCPALLSSMHEKRIERVRKIGLVFATHNTVDNQRIWRDASRYLTRLYERILAEYDAAVICHYIDEVPEAIRTFPNAHVVYSYDARDYLKMYEEFDLVIATRVHGIGLAASLGIPGIHVSHDWRAGTTEGFLAERIQYRDSLETALAKVAALASRGEEPSRALIAHKKATFRQYQTCLAQALNAG